ncbi:hypothetical protein [Neoaquamicrobium sediminum]|uniref:hypothetical protein n=1 Tax=Neoaquamicrobium sediminum TaxID=1849104 RepID=UPI00156639D1|nr:hypothetical protein [Mesorhizobium sediminum]NRC54128.1 hypothetical protein [Mesorhizobium sediminum]
MTVLAEVPKYFGLISFAVKAFIGLKLAQSFLQLTGGLRGANGALVTLGGTLATVRGGFSTFGTTLTRITATLGTASTAAMSLTRIIRLLGAAIMRVPMLALFSVAAYAITELLTGWAGGIDDATSALDEHERLLQEVISAYEVAKDKTEDWAKAVKSGTSTQIRAALVQLRSELKTEIDKVTQTIEDAMAGPTWLSNAGPAFRLTGASKEQVESLKRLADGLRNGAVDLDVFRRSVDDIGKRTNSKIVLELAQQFLEAADKIGQLKDASDQSEAALRLLSGVASEADEEILGLNAAANESADALGGATDSVNGYAEALNKVKGMIPELADEMSKLADIAKLDEAYAAMMKNARTMGEIMQANQWYARARGSINERYTNYEAVYTGQRGTPQGAEMERLVSATIRLAEQMGLSAKDLLTAMSYETGGTFDPWKAGPTTQWGQHRGLIQWGEPQAAQYGVSATTSIEDQIRAVGKYLTDAGVKAGDGLLQIYAAINAGSASKINASDANNGGAPGTVLDKVSGQMGGHQARADGLLAAYGGLVEKTKELVQNEQKANEERVKGEEATAKLLADTEFQIAQQQLIAEGKNREATIEEAIRRAKEQNKNLTAEQIAAITEATGKLWDMQNATAGVEAAEKRVNDLYQLRQELMQQIEYFQGQGELGKADALKSQLENVNAELEAAIAKAIEMWRAIGGPQADLAIAKLNTTKMGIADVGKEAVISGKQIAERFASVLTNALKSMAQAIAEGKDAWEAFSTAFLQGIAEMLIEIGELILKQAILNALQGFFGGFGGGGGGLLGGLLRHDGGRVGAGGHTRAVSPAWFAGAMRLHEGGVAGLRPNEVPAILEKGEVVDPGDGSIFRKMFGGEQQPPTVKVVNTFDSADVLSEGLNSPVGEQAFINVVKRNAGKVRQILGQ